MNPLYKYPLIVLFVLVIIGLGFLIFRNLPREAPEALAGLGETPAVHEGGDGSPAAGAPPGPGSENAGNGAVVAADPSPVAKTLLKSADMKLRQSDLLGARKAAESALGQPGMPVFSAAWRQAANLISAVNTQLFNGDAPAPEKVRYEVKGGDNLVKIARAHNTTVEALIRGNKHIDGSSSMIFPGMVLKIYQGDWRIVVHKQQFLLIIYDGARIFKVYDVAIGRQGRTPVGMFVVRDKLREPAWTPPGKVIPYGDPENVLGTRWLGLKPAEGTDATLKGYGIHGTWEPESIGSAASQGCIRMLNEDVNELFDITPVGTPVTIKD